MKTFVLATAAVIALSAPAFAAGNISQDYLNVQDLKNSITLNHNGDGPVKQEITNTANVVAATVEDTKQSVGNVNQYASGSALQQGSNVYDTTYGMWNNSTQSIANTLNVALADSMGNVTQAAHGFQNGSNYVEFGQKIDGGVPGIVTAEAPVYPQSIRNMANIVDATNLQTLSQTLAGSGQYATNTVKYTGSGNQWTDGPVTDFGQQIANTANVALLASTNFASMSQVANAPQIGINSIVGQGAVDHVRQTAANVANIFTLPSP